MENISIKRLQKELFQINNSDINYIYALPEENNLFKWYYLLIGNSPPYVNGYYLGILIFPNEYPMKPPSIKMITPNGRFEINTRICLSMSDFHPETWNPSWTIESILKALYSFMLEDTLSTGTIESSENERMKFAKESYEYNQRFEIFNVLLNFKKDKNYSNSTSENLIINSDDKICRYCLSNEGELISPCQCKGTNKWVHLDCLKKWQKTSLLSQSTHPKYQTHIEKICNVCKTEFNFKTVSRNELMIEYNSNEILDLIKRTSLIISSEKSSKYNLDLIEKYPNIKESLLNWTEANYLRID